MKKVIKILFNRWILAIIGLTGLSALIWFLGPLIAFAEYRPLESEFARYYFIGFIISFYIGKIIWEFIKSKKLNTRLMEGLLQQITPQHNSTDNIAANAVASLQKRFEEALNLLKRTDLRTSSSRSLLARLNKQYVYELPWYIVIGAPGSGKTTALINSGLQFPLAEHLGSEEIRGVGGTRNCDWFFTNEAVLIDTAGRFVTQESQRDIDSAEWLGFLQLLKKYRPRRPINGVIVTISVTDLLQMTPSQRETQANEIRKRIQELHTGLNIRFPLYVFITKVDLLAGFMEFFNEFGKEERSQVWGITFPVPEKQEDPQLSTNFRSELSVLENRLNDRLISYLQRESDLQRRNLIYSFPQQFSALNETLSQFLNQIFSPSRFEQQPLLRGVYFISGTQEGNPIDRIMSRLAQSLQLDAKLLFPNRPSGKSFFLNKLLNQIIFPEAGLAGTNLRWERQQASIQWSIFTLSIIATTGIIAAWMLSHSQNYDYIDAVAPKIPPISRSVSELPVSQQMPMMKLLSVLRSVQELVQVPGLDIENPPISMELGLYQGDKLYAAANNAYHRLLNNAFLPQIVIRIEALLNSSINSNNTEILYEGLKAYLMLYQAEHYDPIALKAFIVTDWESNLPRDFSLEHRKALEKHLDTLLNQGELQSPIAYNSNLVNTVRQIIAKTPISQRIYNRLKLQSAGSNLPDFTVVRSAGPAASLIFERVSGAPLTKGVPGFYSYEGYYKHFVPAANKASQELAQEEIWVLDLPEKQRSLFSASSNASQVNLEVRKLYLMDYIKAWDTFISDIKLIRPKTLRESIDLTRLLSATDSVLPALLRGIVKEVTLINIEENDKNIVEKASDKVKTVSKTLKQLLGSANEKINPADLASNPEYIVDNHFQSLRLMLQPLGPNQPAPIDVRLSQINDLYMQLSAIEEAIKEKVTVPSSKIFTEIGADARRMPEPLRSMFTTLASDGNTLASASGRNSLNDPLRDNISEFCRQATAGRYPFNKQSKQDVTQADFAQLFGPGGRFDTFFQKELSQYVDTSSRPWRFRQTGELSKSGLSKHLDEFHRAKVIRDIFFNEGTSAKVSVTFTPIDMDPSITQFMLDFDGQVIKYSHGPQIPVSIEWPGPKGSSQVRVQLSPANQEGQKSGLVFSGPWALFRMFDEIQILPSQQTEKFTAIFNIDGRKAQFEVSTKSVQNPFRLKELEQFKCPTKL